MIFDENKEKEAKKWIKLIENTAKIGISNASLLNLSNGEFQLDNSTIVMDKALVDSINFVKEGSFVENGGTPALKLMGSIKDIRTFDGIVVTTPKLKAIEPSDIIIEFLRSSAVDSPIWLLQSFMYLDDMKIIENEAYYKSILLELYEKLLKNKRGNVASCFRKAICRLDEVLFFSK